MGGMIKQMGSLMKHMGPVLSTLSDEVQSQLEGYYHVNSTYIAYHCP